MLKHWLYNVLLFQKHYKLHEKCYKNLSQTSKMLYDAFSDPFEGFDFHFYFLPCFCEIITIEIQPKKIQNVQTDSQTFFHSLYCRIKNISQIYVLATPKELWSQLYVKVKKIIITFHFFLPNQPFFPTILKRTSRKSSNL